MFLSNIAVVCLALLAPADGGEKAPKPSQFERIPAEEATQIENTIRLTVEQQKVRYPGAAPVLRGVHPKDHGCVQATFEVLDTLPEEFRIGVFAKPGWKYDAWIRFSNAAPLVGPDSPPGAHGSRGMAIKLMGVSGNRLLEGDGPLTQDFLMVNHPVFAFANVEDYEALSKIILEDKEDAKRFFADRIHKKDDKFDMSDPGTRRALKTASILARIRSLKVDGDRGAYQEPPACPVDNKYFSGAPYLFGTDKVMKYAAEPVNPQTGGPSNPSDPDYLRKAFHERMTASGAKDIVFNFQVQIRDKADLEGKIDTEIEDACTLWDEKTYPWTTVAKITIKPQDFNTEERRRQCEALFFMPWHSVAEHQPIGGINRLKLGVYRASSAFRHFPKEPSGF
jgi:hypothetical protein